MPISWNEISPTSNGGTELICRRLESSLPADLLDKVQIIPSRVRDLDQSRHRILWCHDLPDDPESKHLENGGWKRFHRIVFVSHWQRQAYVRRFNIPWSKTAVILNGVPFEAPNTKKDDAAVRLIYTSTPQRGLEILVPVFKKLAEKFGDKVHLDVYSSFKIYGWEDRDQQYQPIYDEIMAHPQMSYHGCVANEDVRKALKDAHILAYPSIWPETSCMSLMEAMMSYCLCVHPDNAALSETAANLTRMYAWHDDPKEHAEVFYQVLNNAVEDVRNGNTDTELMYQMDYATRNYAWGNRVNDWVSLIQNVIEQPLVIENKQEFIYRT